MVTPGQFCTLCYTCHYQDYVTVLDSDYKVLFKYKDRKLLIRPISISFDQHQNMLVCNFGKNNLLYISRDRYKVVSLVTEADGLKLPASAHYCAETKSIVIVGEFGDVRIYSVN